MINYIMHFLTMFVLKYKVLDLLRQYIPVTLNIKIKYHLSRHIPILYTLPKWL